MNERVSDSGETLAEDKAEVLSTPVDQEVPSRTPEVDYTMPMHHSGDNPWMEEETESINVKDMSIEQNLTPSVASELSDEIPPEPTVINGLHGDIQVYSFSSLFRHYSDKSSPNELSEIVRWS